MAKCIVCKKVHKQFRCPACGFKRFIFDSLPEEEKLMRLVSVAERYRKKMLQNVSFGFVYYSYENSIRKNLEGIVVDEPVLYQGMIPGIDMIPNQLFWYPEKLINPSKNVTVKFEYTDCKGRKKQGILQADTHDIRNPDICLGILLKEGFQFSAIIGTDETYIESESYALV